MKKKIIIGIAVLFWGIAYLIACFNMILGYGANDIFITKEGLCIFKGATLAAISGNMSNNHILFLSALIGILLSVTMALTLMIIGGSLIWSRLSLPQIPVVIRIGFVIFLFIRIWSTIKHADPGSAFDSLFCLFIILYGWCAKRESNYEVDKVSKVKKMLLYMLLAIILLLYTIPLILNLRLPEGIAIVQ